MMKRTITRGIARAAAVLLAACTLIAAPSCGSGNGNAADTDGRVRLAVVTEGDFSLAFTEGFSPLAAQNDLEFSLSKLTASTLMRETDGGWESVLGTIKLSEKDGKTVADIRINEQVYYSGLDMTATADRYIALLQTLTSIECDGYYKDFFKNPIEGAVAYRYGKIGLRLSDLPDFDALAEERARVTDRESYARLLVETSVTGLFRGNLEDSYLDGRTYRQILEENGETVYEDTELAKMSDAEKLEIVSLALSGLPEASWIVDRIYASMRKKVEVEYRDVFVKDRNNRVPEGISGVEKTSIRALRVRFSRKVDGDEAMRILNLPVMSQNAGMRAGAYIYSGRARGNSGTIAELREKGKSSRFLEIFPIDAESTTSTVKLGQATAALFFEAADGARTERFKKEGLTYEKIGKVWVLYDASVTDRAFLAALEFCY
ncbi:MAG: hypothetical protein IJU52_09125 [Clostridia bacterium]|nr:hypothetical protein [Clostridia bacterium]